MAPRGVNPQIEVNAGLQATNSGFAPLAGLGQSPVANEDAAFYTS
jgi:hypothetical protein